MRGIQVKKSTKGAVAAAAAGVLLLGGAGSLAFWSDSVTIGGDTINSGHLSLDDTTGTDDTCANAPWLMDSAEPGSAFNPLTDKIVPGDTLTKFCTFDVSAIGNHLRADLAATGGTASGTLAPPVTVSSVFTVAGATVTGITEANNGNELKSKITLTFPKGLTKDNTSQGKSLNLTSYVVTATQDHS